MSDPSVSISVLLVADPPRRPALVMAFDAPLVQGAVRVLEGSGGDDTIELFEVHRPGVIVVTASLETGDSRALVEVLRGMTGTAPVSVVVVGDDDGPHRTAHDVADLAPDQFVPSPVTDSALRSAVAAAIASNAALGAGNGTGAGTETGVAPDDDSRSAQRARWAALADSYAGEEPEGLDDAVAIVGDDDILDADEAEPLPPIEHESSDSDPTIDSGPGPHGWRPGSTADVAPPPDPEPPVREPTLILREPVPGAPPSPPPPPPPRRTSSPLAGLEAAIPLTDLLSDPGLRPASADDRERPRDPFVDDLGLDELERDLPDVAAGPDLGVPAGGRDFARQLRAKMSKMAQRLFQGPDAAEPAPVDLRPRHDHHTEIDLASLGEDVSLDRGATEIEAQAAAKSAELHGTTSPGSWDTQIRERGLPDSGEIVRGLSDAAMLLAKQFAQASTGRLIFRQGDVEKVIFCDQGRPVFAASSQRRDRMGELLVREGKITLTQYERCQTVVAESGRRMGEILVDLGYLKRRELLPAVRRHVEDIVYSLFGWEHGTYHVALDPVPSAERIRLSRHPASLIIEGIRRKLDRSSLERLIGPPSTVLELPDRERLGGIINLGDLSAEERAALAAFDAQADLAAVARSAGVDVADLLPLAWGLCALGLANARRTDTEVPDETSALVGETDLAIDRERVRARWDLVEEADYFALLGVRRDATAFEIRRAYQSARRDFAADGFPPDLRRELAQELDDIAHVLDEAFRVLRDDRLRVTYLTNLVG